MRVTMLLADAAQAVNGKLYVLGGGWSQIGPDPSPMAIAMKVDVPWDQANRPHEWMLELVDADGKPVPVRTATGEQPVRLAGRFEVGRPAGLPPGTPIDLPLAISIGPFPLPSGRRLVWRLTVDGETREDWQVGFSVRPPAPGRRAGPTTRA